MKRYNLLIWLILSAFWAFAACCCLVYDYCFELALITEGRRIHRHAADGFLRYLHHHAEYALVLSLSVPIASLLAFVILAAFSDAKEEDPAG